MYLSQNKKNLKKRLISFEEKISRMYENKLIRGPVHLSGNNEEQLIKIFKKINKNDWVFSNWRNHYHAILKGISLEFLEKQIKKCKSKGISENKIIIDPGIGFGKTLKQNLTLIKKISLLHSLGLPVMLGSSRKSFIGKIQKNELYDDRRGGSIASVLYGLSQGIQIFRVHDVYETNQAIKVYSKLI